MRLTLPLLVPLITAVLAMLLRRHPGAQRAVSLIGAAGLLTSSLLLAGRVASQGIQVVQVGNWRAPFGITLVADHLSAAMLVIAGVIGLAVAIYSIGELPARWSGFQFHFFLHLLLTAVAGGFLTGDVFNLYVWLEVMLITSFALLIMGGAAAQIEGAVKYVVLNLLATLLLLIGIAALYGLTGTLNLADLARRLPEVGSPGLQNALALMFMVALGIKAAVFPLFFWLPASYHTPAVSVTALFSGLLTKMAVYALLRLFSLLFVGDLAFTHGLLMMVAALTMLTGVLGAAAHIEIRRILSFHIISQIGYIVMGLGLLTRLSLAGAVYFLAHNIMAKANLFLIGGLVQRLTGSSDLRESGGLYRSHPLLSASFLISALSLAGYPPLSGFWAKLVLVKASFEAGRHSLGAMALIVGLLTAYSMTKIWNLAFWAPPAGPAGVVVSRRGLPWLVVPVLLLAAATLLLSFGVEPALRFADGAAGELLSRSGYITAVLGGEP